MRDEPMLPILAITLHLPDDAATRDLGAQLASGTRPGMSIHLRGELGAGKTTLARALIHALGYVGKVKSPTYTLVELYPVSRLDLYHFDFYRLRDPAEMEEAGFRECFNDASVCLVEWPERAEGSLPGPDLRVTLAHAASGRDATIEAFTEKGRACLENLRDRPSRPFTAGGR